MNEECVWIRYIKLLYINKIGWINFRIDDKRIMNKWEWYDKLILYRFKYGWIVNERKSSMERAKCII